MDGSRAGSMRTKGGMNFMIHTTRNAALALCAALVWTTPAGAESLADAMAKAYIFHPTLAAQRATLRALDEVEYREWAARLGSADVSATYQYQNSDSVGASFDPATGRSVRVRSRQDTDPFALGIGGSIPLYSGGRIENGTQAAEAGVQSGRLNLAAVEQDVLLDAVEAYENVRRDIALVGVARNNVRVIGEQLRAAQDRFEVGEVTRTDVSQAAARLAAARSNLAAVIGQLAQSRQFYRATVGELPEDLQDPPPLPELPESEAAAIALAENQHPLIVAARFDARQAEFEVKRAIGATLPSVALEGDVAYTDASIFTNEGDAGVDGNSASVGVRASMPLWSGGRNASVIRQNQAQLARAQALIHNQARLVRQQVSNAWAGVEVARTSITAAREQIEAARIAFEGVREEATLGARTTLDVLDAEQELQSARAELISSLRDEYVAGYTLLSAVGALSVAHLGLDVARYDPQSYRDAVEEAPYDALPGESTMWSSRWKP